MIKQRKLKHKKNFDKRFHTNIHEFAVSRPQKKKKESPSPLLETLTDINRKRMEPFLVKSQCFYRSIRPEIFLKNVKNLQNSRELNAGVGVSFV